MVYQGSRVSRPRHYLMCRPTHFEVVYSINPWMDPSRCASADAGLSQWKLLHDLLVDLGHTVDLIEPSPGLPDMVFAANGAVAVGGQALVARFRHEQRAPEAAGYLEWFGLRGWREVRQADFVNEGEGDFLQAGSRILAGTGFRTEPKAHREAEEFFGRPVVGLTLIDPRFYHLDTALAVLDNDEIMYYPGAFAPESRDLLAALYPDAVLAEEADAVVFGLNAVSDGRHVLLPAGTRNLAGELRDRGFVTFDVTIAELLKAGGGVKCCTLELHTHADSTAAGGSSAEMPPESDTPF
ncbi:dimethylargininase [Actinoplanes palleronii]|nr:dimethylargininase [Actinoplanes palleronii]